MVDPESGSVVAHAPALSDEVIYPKERALVELALRERTRGRRLLVYITHTERRDISPRLRRVLEQAGLVSMSSRPTRYLPIGAKNGWRHECARVPTC